MTHYHYGMACAVLSGVFFGLIGYFGLEVMHASVSVYSMLFWRFFVSALFICLLFLVYSNKNQERWQAMFKVVFYGAVFYSTSSILYFMASERVGSGLAMVIFFVYPAIVMLLEGLVFKSAVSKMYCVPLAVILVGIGCLVYGQEMILNWQGIGFAILSAFLFALYIIAIKNNPTSPLYSTLMVSIGSVFTCGMAAWINHSFIVPVRFNVWENILGIGIICTALPIILLMKGLTHIGTVQASIASVIEPIFVVVAGVFLLGESINSQQIVGILIILSGVLITLLQKPES